MEQIVLYSRVSLSSQSFVSQYDDLRKWAKANNFEIVAEFGEKVSGFDLSVERTEYENMKEFVLQNNIKHIGIWELSRLGRNTLTTLNEIEFFTKKGVNIFFKKENIWSLSTEPTTKLLLSLLSSLSELERNNIIERSTRGRTSSVLKGKAGFGILPYGFCKDGNGFLKIEQEEAKVIKIIYDMGLKGVSLRGGSRTTLIVYLYLPGERCLNTIEHLKTERKRRFCGGIIRSGKFYIVSFTWVKDYTEMKFC